MRLPRPRSSIQPSGGAVVTLSRIAILAAAIAAMSLPMPLLAQAPKPLVAVDANEPMEVGPEAPQDAAVLAEARSGWWAAAAKTKDARLAWWRDARFGAFIHWGPYSNPAGEWKGKPSSGYAEHIMRASKIPLKQYREEVVAKFQPDAFDAKSWIKLIKSTGMRYVIITAKHHDGFAMWPSKVGDFTIAQATSFKRDPMKELVDAARAEGLKVGFYYSHAFDWEDPDAAGNDWDYDNPGGDKGLHGGRNWWRTYPQFLANTDRYIDRKVIPQLLELLQYKPDIMWFDTPHKIPFFQQAKIVKAVRAADPDVVINGRAAGTGEKNLGDYANTADRPAEVLPTPGDWEAIPTTNESYGYNKLDRSFKPLKYFIQMLAKVGAKGGNLLLNLGPRGDGSIDPPDVAIMHGVGRWMSVNGESIWGAQRTPLDRQPWGDSTLKGDSLYLHVFRWPSDRRLVVHGLLSDVHGAYLMADPKKTPLPVKRAGPNEIAITVPAGAPDPNDSVVVLQSQGAVRAEAGRVIDLGYGENQLLAFDAKADGKGFSYGDGKAVRYYADGLEQLGNTLTWMVRGTRAGPVRVQVRYSTYAPTGGKYVLRYGDQTKTVAITPTAKPETLTLLDFGTLQLAAGKPTPMTLTIEGAQPKSVHTFELLLGRP